MEPEYATVDDQVLEALRQAVGEAAVVTDAERLETYGRDETEELFALPEVAVVARSTADVAAVMRLAQDLRVPVTPRTGGTGVTGGAVPHKRGIVLDLSRMDRILEIDVANFAAVVQPGVITGAFQRAVEEKGLFYPPDPASLDSCTLGGNVAENAGGPRALKWGVTRNFVTGLEVVFPGGGVARLGGKLRKNVTGFDLIGLLTGSEGTLGVVTEITLRLLPKPPVTVDFLAPFPTLLDAAAAVAAVMRTDEIPAVVEFMDRLCVEAVGTFLNRDMPHADAGAHLLVQLVGKTEASVYEALEQVGEVCLDGGALEVYVADSASMRERMWEMRRQLREALRHRCPTKFSEDVVVPPSRMPELIRRAKAVGESAGVEVACFGHVGDGNVHVNVLQGGLSDAQWQKAKPDLIRRILQTAVDLSGTLSGEHGIGLTKLAFLRESLPPAAWEAMKAIKAALDPHQILNPGKAI